MKIRMLSLLFLGLALQTMPALAQERLPEYLQAEKFTREKLNTMLFSTTVDRRPRRTPEDSAFRP